METEGVSVYGGSFFSVRARAGGASIEESGEVLFEVVFLLNETLRKVDLEGGLAVKKPAV